jgi:A/G-specific adenine glycosylase
LEGVGCAYRRLSVSTRSDLAARVVHWQAKHGRNNLPWQNTRDPYRVWLSEIMLQQTQVVTVLDYFERFLRRFPDVGSLASASLDDVLALWSGLGYYSRARNLYACAGQVMALHGGNFPDNALTLQTLPGIGRSTAGAIAALCFNERVAILDGNVKRVLTRFLGFDSDLAVAANERALWDQATTLLPRRDLNKTMQPYTQGMMDLGATVCLTKKPLCKQCPLAGICIAGQSGEPEKYPVKTRKLKRSSQSLWLLWAQAKDGSVLLSQRPTPGVWAGLYCFALFESREALEQVVPQRCRAALQDQAAFKHVLTHKDLHLHTVFLPSDAAALQMCDGQWFLPQQWPELGLPAPIRRLLSGGQPAC